MKAREFLFRTEDLTMAALPASFPRPERKVMWTILQFHWGNPNVHFELQPQPSRGLVELGLHFEGPVEANDAWTEFIAGRAHEVMCALGPSWELEVWTASWRRLHRPWRVDALSLPLAEEVAAEFARALIALQPIVFEGMETLGAGPASPAGKSNGAAGESRGRRRFARGRR